MPLPAGIVDERKGAVGFPMFPPHYGVLLNAMALLSGPHGRPAHLLVQSTKRSREGRKAAQARWGRGVVFKTVAGSVSEQEQKPAETDLEKDSANQYFLGFSGFCSKFLGSLSAKHFHSCKLANSDE